jgi:hypothetical protein
MAATRFGPRAGNLGAMEVPRPRLAGGAASGAARSPSARLCLRLRKKGYFVLLGWRGHCVGNTTRVATLDSMREVPTWPYAPPAPWPRHHPGVGENAVGPPDLFRADCNLHDEARAGFAALIKCLEIGDILDALI